MSISIDSIFTLLCLVQVTLFHFEDKPRADSLDVINTLQNEGNLRVMMLTGDHELSARRVADAVGIKEFHCSLKPEDKLYHVTKIPRDTGIYYQHSYQKWVLNYCLCAGGFNLGGSALTSS